MWDDSKPILENYLFKPHLDHQCCLIKREYLDKCGHYDSRLPRSQDCDLIVRMILNGGTWTHVQKQLFVFEKHEDDQNKQIASIHGKALWTLKNDLNINWMSGLTKDMYNMLGVVQAINDFSTKPEWKEDFEKSKIKEALESHKEILFKEVREKVGI